MKNKSTNILQKGIQISFYALFFLTPLVFTPINSELFELNKMALVYFFASLIFAFWFIKSIMEGKLVVRRTPLDIPILLFLLSQIVSTLFSLDFYVSLWGYYGRFNGGLIPTTTYLFLYYAFISNIDFGSFNKESKFRISNLRPELRSRDYEFRIFLSIILLSGFLVSIYAILQRLGIDKDIWVQDVQNRVFSTLGQPNWLAAYIVILLPITMALSIKSKIQNYKLQINSKSQILNSKMNIKSNVLKLFGTLNLVFRIFYFMPCVLCLMFYAVLLFTKSRSGFLAFWVVDIIFWLGLIILIKEFRKKLVSLFVICHLSFVILTFIFSSPFPQVNKYLNPFKQLTTDNKPVITNNQSFDYAQDKQPTTENRNPTTDITESGEIRKLVWQGAIEAFKAKPLFGWGVETFAWVFYKFKPLEHNLISEWDFLYNKAHNEYLNYAAASGGFGLESYLILIAIFVFLFIKNSKLQILSSKSPPKRDPAKAGQISNPKYKNSKQKILSLEFKNLNLFEISNFEFRILQIGLFAGWLSILITNFFGFSVVVVSLFFYLIPAIAFSQSEQKKYLTINLPQDIKAKVVLLFFILLFAVYCLLFTLFFWLSDVYYAKAVNYEDQEEYSKAYEAITTAVKLKPDEPNFRDQLALESAYLSLLAYEQDEATRSADFAKQAEKESDLAIAISPNNLNFRKTRTRLFYVLTQMDDLYLRYAIHSLLAGLVLSPNDAKIRYNLAILYWSDDQKEEAKKTLYEALELKPNYKDAAYGLAVFAEQEKDEKEAQKWYRYILENIDPSDEEVKKKISPLKN